MQQFRLINGSNRVVYPGDLCKLHATKKNSFDLAQLGDIIIGTSTQQVSPGSWCVLNPLGMVDWSNIQEKPALANKAKLDALPKITVSDTAPGNPSVNDIWIDSSQN